MPLFEYRCTECGHVTEFLERTDAEAEHACEQCGSTKTKKALSAFSARVAGACPSAGTCPDGTCPLR